MFGRPVSQRTDEGTTMPEHEVSNSILRALMRDRSGNVAMMWAVSALAITGFAGLSIDFARAYTYREQLQAAADAAILAAEKARARPLADREALARRAFLSNLGEVERLEAIQINFESLEKGSRVTVSGPLPVLFGSLVGFTSDWRVTVSAAADSGQDSLVEVALVLDNTGSMRNDMGTLRSASKDLANTIFDAGSEETLKVAVVPFVATVNIGNSADRTA
jgi:Flp pilus assembly protein TadG